MPHGQRHPLNHLSLEDTLIATYVWVDDQLKALVAQGLRLPRQPRQKATYAELLAIALGITLLGLDFHKGYLLVGKDYRHLFPRLPHLTRFYRVLRNLHALNARLALSLVPPDPDGLKVIDLKPVGLCHGRRMRGHRMDRAAVGRGPLGYSSGFRLAALVDGRGLFVRWGLLPGNAHENDSAPLVAGLGHGLCLGDSGFRWVGGVLTPPYRLKGGKRVGTGWQAWMYPLRNPIESRFATLVRPLGLHRLECKSYWALLSRVNLILCAANLLQSRTLLRIAGVGGA
ncbi:Transposase DDE domain protein [Calidithermus terrae]|uniref:Transposase DDE domain protein n=1 Tax=Calidithermus terrae TaxID=1408545 RepID=A0A399ET57_9DEIN|nr:transposase [Calidithermus terrae]RIH86696.1 Transposase DDE domain protein [Calidithermus terrae]